MDLAVSQLHVELRDLGHPQIAQRLRRPRDCGGSIETRTTMPKNILVFSDGTGQAGGLTPDEKRSNVYKLFRATRCGPEPWA